MTVGLFKKTRREKWGCFPCKYTPTEEKPKQEKPSLLETIESAERDYRRRTIISNPQSLKPFSKRKINLQEITPKGYLYNVEPAGEVIIWTPLVINSYPPTGYTYYYTHTHECVQQ